MYNYVGLFDGLSATVLTNYTIFSFIEIKTQIIDVKLNIQTQIILSDLFKVYKVWFLLNTAQMRAIPPRYDVDGKIFAKKPLKRTYYIGMI